MENIIQIKELDKKIDFAKLIFTTSNVDMANEADKKKVCIENNLNYERLTKNKQIHSGIVNVIKNDDVCNTKDGDAIITNLQKTPLMIVVADCVPIGLMDSKNKAVGLAHAGWRGTYENIANNTIKKMKEEYNTSPSDLIAVIGPSIGPCCYEVSEELVEKFNIILTNADEKFYIIEEDKFYLDLWKINKHMLLESGVKEENIISLNLCTNCNSDKFHSYRKHNQTTKRLGMLVEIR